LYPFNRCNVVRIVIKPSDFLNIPIIAIPYKYIIGIILRHKERRDILKLLKFKKGWNIRNVGIFPLL